MQNNEYKPAHSGYWVYVLSRINKNTGYTETIHYTGDIKDKPKGYSVIDKIWNRPYTCNGVIY